MKLAFDQIDDSVKDFSIFALQEKQSHFCRLNPQRVFSCHQRWETYSSRRSLQMNILYFFFLKIWVVRSVLNMLFILEIFNPQADAQAYNSSFGLPWWHQWKLPSYQISFYTKMRLQTFKFLADIIFLWIFHQDFLTCLQLQSLTFLPDSLSNRKFLMLTSHNGFFRSFGYFSFWRGLGERNQFDMAGNHDDQLFILGRGSFHFHSCFL